MTPERRICYTRMSTDRSGGDRGVGKYAPRRVPGGENFYTIFMLRVPAASGGADREGSAGIEGIAGSSGNCMEGSSGIAGNAAGAGMAGKEGMAGSAGLT